MRVIPEQLQPGCVLLKDVIGKSNRPIMDENTILTDESITIIKKFLINSVDVAAKLHNGEPFTPILADGAKKDTKKPFKNDPVPASFIDQYLSAVEQYKKLYHNWQSVSSINIANVRQLFIPLLKRIDEIGLDVFTLNRYVKGENYFYHHSIAVGLLSAFLAKGMNFKVEEWMQIGLAGLLSDCGMSKIDQKIVRKQSRLTDAEFTEVKKHPTYSYQLIKHVSILSQSVKIAVLQHHERNNGSGYPLGVKKEKIHMYAQVIAVCDMYHAMICERVYKDKQSPFKALEQLQQEQFSQLDPVVVQTLIKSMTNFSIGTRVRLSDGSIGEIIFVEGKYPTRPMVRLQDETKAIISLKENHSLYIDEILHY